MRHRRRQRKLGRTSEHRSALFRNQLASMVQNERIVTTLAKAKELRPIIEKMVTLGREDTVHHRRRAAVSMPDKGLLKRLFEDIGPRFSDRPGGYTRIIKLGPRKGDGAEMAILEFVDYEREGAPEPAPKKSKKKAKAEDTEAEEPDTETTEGGDDEAKPKKTASKKSGAKKSSSKKSSAKSSSKSSSKKAPAKKASATKSSSKKSSSKKSSSKKKSS